VADGNPSVAERGTDVADRQTGVDARGTSTAPQVNAPAPTTWPEIRTHVVPEEIVLGGLIDDGVVLAVPEVPGWQGLLIGDLVTNGPTQVIVKITREQARVDFAPPLLLRNTLIPDLSWASATYNFRLADAWINATGMDAVTGKVANTIRSMLHAVVRDTPMAEQGYDPIRDDHLFETLSMLNLGSGGGTSNAQGSLADHVTGCTVEVTAHLMDDVDRKKDSIDFRVAINSHVHVAARLGGSLADILDRRVVARELTIEPEDAVLSVRSEDVARLTSLKVRPGGAVTVQYSPRGTLRTVEHGESFGRLLVSGATILVAVLANRIDVIDDIAEPASKFAQRNVVHEYTAVQIEAGFREALVDLAFTYRRSIPGVNLITLLGLEDELTRTAYFDPLLFQAQPQ
jgi:hypothetical protein